LTAATGLGESSLYNAFGDKRTLYCEALDHFFAMLMRVWQRESEGQTPLNGLRKFWYWMCEDAAGKHRGLGCMVVNTAVEVAPHDAEIRAKVRKIFADIETVFRATLQQAQDDGELAPDKNVEAIARFLTHSTQGIRVMAKVNPPKAYMRDVAEQTLSVLD
jgi:TetR/AcrR family transcriptional repressor of nem operon